MCGALVSCELRSDRPTHPGSHVAVQSEFVCLSPSIRKRSPLSMASVSSDQRRQDLGADNDLRCGLWELGAFEREPSDAERSEGRLRPVGWVRQEADLPDPDPRDEGRRLRHVALGLGRYAGRRLPPGLLKAAERVRVSRRAGRRGSAQSRAPAIRQPRQPRRLPDDAASASIIGRGRHAPAQPTIRRQCQRGHDQERPRDCPGPAASRRSRSPSLGP